MMARTLTVVAQGGMFCVFDASNPTMPVGMANSPVEIGTLVTKLLTPATGTQPPVASSAPSAPSLPAPPSDKPHFKRLADGTWGVAGCGAVPEVGSGVVVFRKDDTSSTETITEIVSVNKWGWVARIADKKKPVPQAPALPPEPVPVMVAVPVPSPSPKKKRVVQVSVDTPSEQ